MEVTKICSKICFIKVSVVAFLLLSSILHISCNKRVSDDTQSGIGEDSLAIKMEVLQDSLQKAWDDMINDDDEKLGYMRRLLSELSYADFKPSKIEELNNMVDELKILRYDQKTMADSHLIDQYDSATSVVTRRILDFGYEFIENRESDLVQELMNEISQKNNYVLIYRVHYDSFAEEINLLIDTYGDKLKERNIEVEKKPLFKLPMEDV